MAGRPSKPNALKQLAGTLQPCRMKNEVDLGNLNKIPPAPKYFSKLAKKIYKTTANKLIKVKLLNEVNISLVVAYAEEMGKYYDTEEKLNGTTGRTYSIFDKQGNEKIVRNPLDSMASEYLENAKKIAVELGITPASSSRVKMPVAKNEDDLSKFLENE